MSSRAYAQYTISDIRDGIDGLGILEIEEQYYKSRCNTPPLAQNDSSYNENNWDTQPTWEEGYYIWTRVKITWDNDVNDSEHITYTTPVLATTYQSLHSDIINNVIPNIATKDSNGNWSIVSGVLHNTFVYYTDEEGQQQPVRLENLGSTIVQTANEIRQEVSNNYVSSNEIDASYVICNTSASTATKIATCYNQDASSSFELSNGTRITCVFANGNTAENPTLSVNGTTAKPIRTFGGNALTESEYTWDAGTTFTLVYNTSNGGSWNIEGSEGVLKVYSNSTLIDQTANNILIQATKNSNTASAAGSALIQSFINVAPEQIKISADRINFEGSAVFSSFVTDQDLEAMQADIEQYARNLTSDMATNTSVSNTYATKTTAIKRSQRIYKQTNQVDANNNPVVPDPATDLRNPSTNLDTWVATNVAVYDTWTTKRMSYSRDYPYIWTCEQRETVSGELAYTPVLLDDTTTVIDGGSIITNSIAANRIIAHSITSNELATNVVTSLNYSPPTVGGTAPYSVAGSTFDLQYGNIITPHFVVDNENGNAYLKGTIETRKGLIGGFVITENSIYHNKRDVTSVDLSDDVFIISSDPYVLDQEDYLYGGYATLYEVYMGVDGISCGFGKFAVDSSGELFASNATIKGNITATSGSFGLTNGYYEIDDDGLVGYRIGIVYYFKMIEILSNEEYDEGSVEATSLSLETSSRSYSYSDILAIDVVTGIGLKNEDDKLFIILKTNSTTPISEIFDGTITSISCSYTYKKSDEELGGFGNVQDYTGLTTPSTENNDYITGTELGYDYLKTDKIIASDGIVITTDNSNFINTSRLQLDYHSMKLLTKNNIVPYFWVSDLRNENGEISESVEIEWVDDPGGSSTVDYMLAHEPKEGTDVILKINGYEVEATDWYTRSIYEPKRFIIDPYMLPNPVNNISFTYVTDEEVHGYTFGKRKGGLIAPIGSYSVVEGFDNTASGLSSHAQGESVIASGKYSTALGLRTAAEGDGSLSLGMYVYEQGNRPDGGITGIEALDEASIAHGYVGDNENSYIKAYDRGAVASGVVGDNAFILAQGIASKAFGYVDGWSDNTTQPPNITTAGIGSFASGFIEKGDMGTGYYADGAVALNTGTWALGKAQTVIGTFNALDTQGNVTNHPSNSSGNSSAYYTKYAFIIGNGYWNKTNNTEVRSNAMTVDWFGHITALSFEVPTGHDLLLKSNGGTYTARLTQYGNFRPETTRSQDLGTDANRWRIVYCQSVNDNSDGKLKDNIDDILFSKELIMNIKPITFMWKDGDHRRKQMGFIAQDVAKVCKNIGENLSLVSASYKSDEQKIYLGEDVDDSLLNWGMSYNQLIAPMVSIIQSHENTIIELKNKINKLESYIKEIKG